MIRRRKSAPRPDPARLTPPEGVPLRLPIAPLGSRVAAQVVDVVLTSLGAIALLIVLLWLRIAGPNTAGAIFMLLFFIIRIPYYVVAELVWNGQTLGKRLMSIKVVSHDGGPLTTHALVLRNLMKEAEVFLPGQLLLTLSTDSPVSSLIALAWIIMVLLVPLLNRYRMRLGDLMAQTHVIALPQLLLLDDMARSAPARQDPQFTFLPHQLDHYGAFELQTLEGLLRQSADGKTNAQQRATLTAITGKIRAKIGYADPIAEKDSRAFLAAFYTAQREHLEQRQLFGDRRADKFHAAPENGGDAPQNRRDPARK